MKPEESAARFRDPKQDQLAVTCVAIVGLVACALLIVIGSSVWSLVPTLYPLLTPHPASADAIAGRWQGNARASNFTFDITVTIDPSCEIGDVCGPFDIPSMPCSGNIILDDVRKDTYSFKTTDIQGVCGKAYSDTLTLLPDGTLLYVSTGEYGESRGVLHRTE